MDVRRKFSKKGNEVIVTAGEGIKKGAEGTKNVTDKSVDAVEAKINKVTDTVEGALRKAADAVHSQAGRDTPSGK